MDYKNKYLKYKNKYIELKKRINLKGGEQYFVKKRGPSGEIIKKTIDTSDGDISTNLRLIDRIREIYSISPDENFKIIIKPETIYSIEKIERPIIIRSSEFEIITEKPIVIDIDGETILKKLFKYLLNFSGDDYTQIIVVPFSSNTQPENSKKNIIQQFQPSSINPYVHNLIYVLFDKAFLKNTNKEFFDYINFYEIQDLVDVLELTPAQKNKIKVFYKPKNMPFTYKDSAPKKEVATAQEEAAASYTDTREHDYSSTIFSNYISLFESNVAPLINDKFVTFYVINIDMQRNFDFITLSKQIGDNCTVQSFEGWEYK